MEATDQEGISQRHTVQFGHQRLKIEVIDQEDI
jgi:hypothetical protein